MKRLLLTVIIFIGAFNTHAQNYDASLISKDLLPHANAVSREDEMTIEVKDYDNVIYHVKRIITVLNKNGDDIAHMAVWHNKNNIIRYIKGVAYNEFGKQIRKFSEHDFEDVSAASGYSLFEDSRVKHFIPAITEYPYTIAYEYEVRSKQSLVFEDWAPNPTTSLAVEKSTFRFICKPDFNIRYKELNVPSRATLGSTVAGLKTYTWQVSNLKAVRNEPFSPDFTRYLTMVLISPEKFTYENISGSFTNWNEMGRWIYDKLLKGRDNLSAETIAHIKEITAGIADPKEKARKVYEYMQQKTRYVSVQIGIGGYQPFSALDVDRLNYGDCKALVNYTHALLKAVDVDSYYCIVKSGGNKISMMNDFASMNQADHVILCMPFKNDTTWLECTSQKMPFGFLGKFTDDRVVLACTPEGGKLLHTPKYSAIQNVQVRKADFNINDEGELSGSMATTFKGTQYENRDYILEEPKTEQLKEMQKIYSINNLDIQNYSFKQEKTHEPAITETVKLNAREYASMSDGKLYFMLNPERRVNRAPRELRNRINLVNINRGYTDEDEITYNLPKGYRVFKEPLNISLTKPFGKFSASMSVNGDHVVYKRRLQFNDGEYPRDTYDDLVNFYETVVEADNYTVTLIKNTN